MLSYIQGGPRGSAALLHNSMTTDNYVLHISVKKKSKRQVLQCHHEKTSKIFEEIDKFIMTEYCTKHTCAKT